MARAQRAFPRRRAALPLTASLILAGCATLPAEEAGAFKKIAAADKDAFTSLAEAEAQGVSGLALKAEGGRFQLNSGCSSAMDGGPCEVTVVSGTVRYDLDTQAPLARKLISGIAEYGASMSELATATDLDAAKAGTAAVGASIKSLAALVPGVGALPGAVIDAGVWLGQQRLVSKRRQALLAAAKAADPVIAKASATLGPIAQNLKTNLVNASSLRVTNAAQRVGASIDREKHIALQLEGLPPGRIVEHAALDEALHATRVARQADSSELIAAAKGLNGARAIDTDFSSLAKAHRTLLEHLQDPRVSLEDALADLNTFLSHVDALKRAAKGA